MMFVCPNECVVDSVELNVFWLFFLTIHTVKILHRSMDLSWAMGLCVATNLTIIFYLL